MATKTPKNGSKVIESRTLGHRNVLNTDWPIEAYLSRDYTHHKITGYVVEVICNGINDLYKPFKTRREAEAYYRSL